MKITIKESVQKQKKIKLEELEPGTIIEFDVIDSPSGLVFDSTKGKEILLLTLAPDIPWFEIAMGWKTMPIRKILGKLTEIVVDPNLE
jgi:hypothetical protein